LKTLWRLGLANHRPGRQKGVIRYSHVGEGAYQKTESVIKQLLAEGS
jgi:hypothetical protein